MTFAPDPRPRRLRRTPALRRLVGQTRLHPADLVLPLFVKEGLDEPAPIASMPGVLHHTEESLAATVRDAARAGLGGVMLFGVPARRDATGSGATDPDGVLNRAIRIAADASGGDVVVMADLCLDEFTDHGHCGVLGTGPDGEAVVDNDATLVRYAQMALAQAEAGADVLGLSGMMDGQVRAVRQALAGRHEDVAVLAYAAKYASAFYGPFRDAVESTLEGDRRSYQMDPANRREGLRELDLDLAEGADIVMTKPALGYLDVLADVASRSPVPVAAYQVSGEYSMIEAAAERGWIDRRAAIEESVLGIRRAGADIVLTYWALELAEWIAMSAAGATGADRAPAAPTAAEVFARARAILPGGVSSPVRAYRSVGGDPRFIASARGPYVTDVHGREYVDLVCSWGPALLGHAHPSVVAAVQEAAARGLSFGAPTVAEAELGEEIRRRVPAVERVRLVSTGTEATMTAIRLARGVTGRPVVVKFAGCYHGHVDALLAEAGSGVATLGIPGSAGVTEATAAETVVLPYNDLDAVERLFAEHGPRIAAVIAEAAPANAGVIPPGPGFNAGLRRITAQHGALFVLDEVLTGFRVGPSGWWGLEGAAGWAPDLFTFGKVIGGGMPVAAVAGRAEVMDALAPVGPVYQAGTLSGNPVAVAAGLATLRAADDAVYARVDHVASTIGAALGAALSGAGLPHRVQHAGSLFSVFFGEEAAVTGVPDYAAAQRSETYRYPALFHSLLAAGVTLPPSAFEAWFVSAAHDDAAVERVLDALPAAARAAAGAVAPAR